MTFEEAVKIIPTIREYFMWHDVEKGVVNLDGFFTIDQLEAMVVLYRNKHLMALQEEVRDSETLDDGV